MRVARDAVLDANGSTPTTTIPLLRPRLPTADQIHPYLERVDATRRYTNDGPLEQEFKQRLGTLFGVDAGSIVPVASGTVALTLALRAVARPGTKYCLMPAWTFVATPLAAVQAGLEPMFADVDPASWALSPDAIASHAQLDKLGALVVVAPFGRCPDVAAWARFSETTGVPVVIDAAAAFDAVSRHRLAGTAGKIPIVLSLHATKAFGIGEGGLIVCADPRISAACARLKSFGFAGGRIAHVRGLNAKISEYQAAVGLAALDRWEETRSGFSRAISHYIAQLSRIETVEVMPRLSGDAISATLTIMTPRRADDLIAVLGRNGIECRRWWEEGCHRQPAFADSPRDPLPVTDRLAAHVVGLPMSQDMSEREIDRVCDTLSRHLEPA